MTSLPLWPFAIGFLPYLFVHSAPANQAGSNAPLPPANHGCRLAGGVILVMQICVAVLGFSQVGLVQFHAIFASYPLMVMALSVPFLGETVGWRRWLAVGCGFLGVLVILQPGSAAFGSIAIIPLCAAVLMATYGVLTRFAARSDNAMTSFFWTGKPALLPSPALRRFSGIRRKAQIGGGWHCYASLGRVGIIV